MSFEVTNFGKTSDGQDIHLIKIINSNNVSIEITDMGASIVSLFVPDKDGMLQDIVLGHRSGECYQKYNGDLFGTIVGRNSNRISNHSFEINGVRYELEDNHRGMNIHSGPYYYGGRLLEYEFIDDEEGQGVEFSLFSQDGDQGMPGNLDFCISYVLTEDNSLVIEYNGVSDKDTIFNVTNHSYFNLNGHDSGNIDEHDLWINATKATYTESYDIADAKIYDITGTAMDFSTMKPIGECIHSEFPPVKRCRGLDHNYCLEGDGTDVLHVARLESKKSGRRVDVFTDRPGMQVYTANGIDNKYTTKNEVHYQKRCGIALETQHYPDAINHPNFPSPIIKAGEHFNFCTVYKFSLIDEE